MLNSKTRSIVLLALAAAAIVGATHTASAQICPGSNLYYFVRDAKGAFVDAGRTDLKYEGDGAKGTYSHWATEALDADHLRSKEVQPEILRLNGKAALKNQAMCNFRNDLRLRVTLSGQTMNLIFHMPPLSQYPSDVDSKDFVVDSLPFKEGDYEITLNVPPDTWLNFYPGNSWKRMSAATK